MAKGDRLHVPTGRPGQVVLIALIFGVPHSVLASNAAKRAATQVIGPRWRQGVYRFAYIIQTLVLAALGTGWFLRLPDRVIYKVSPPWSYLMRGGQVGGVALLAWSIFAAHFTNMTGLHQVASLIANGDPPQETVAQGPALAEDGRILDAGPYRWTRHPGDLSSILIFGLFPRMTVNLAVLATLAISYCIVGAFHEEARLMDAYGNKYENYRRKVSFMLPGTKALVLLLDHKTDSGAHTR